MKKKFLNFYFLFFSLTISSAIFPSIMGNYDYYIIPLGFGTFILDEIILLISLFFTFIKLLTSKTINQIITKASVLLIFILCIIFLTFFSFLREDNLNEIISRDRWIILNTFILLMPFAYQLTFEDLKKIFNKFILLILILVIFKLFFYIFFGPNQQLSQFGPSFIFIINICICVYLWTNRSIFKKCFIIFFTLIISFLGQQISGILMTLLSVFIVLYIKYFNINFLQKLILCFLFYIGYLVLLTSDLTIVIDYFNLNPLNFTITDKINTYYEMWIYPFENLTFFQLIFGRGAGYYFEMFGNNGYYYHSLLHNVFLTIFSKFGLLGLFVFLIILSKIFLNLNSKFNFQGSLLLKIILFIIIFNFFSTAGIWKIRKGIFLWFIIGILFHLKLPKLNKYNRNI